ncbi:hypothetical protein GF339_22970, partial [candidate division KSB3 bacterium]|nr:hypothetical protein [candidate division KSB3 bacterium]MBD3327466.1 hypothetical protein [candidate division KSB3 bacterium]
MTQKVLRFLITFPRQSALYALLVVLVLLLLAWVVNTKNWRPLKGKSEWVAASNYSQEGAHFGIDRDLDTYWSSYFPMSFGMFYQVDIGTSATVNGILLRVGEDRQGQPAEWVVRTSLDGIHWQTPALRKAIQYRSMLLIPFDALQVRYVHIVQTSVAASSAWLIHELDLLQPVVPWQVERSTLLGLIGGVLLGLLVVGMLPLLPPMRVSTLLLLLVILLLGWTLRVYDLRAYDLSDQEVRYLSALALDKYGDEEWVKAYIDYANLGGNWLILLFVRWMYQASQSAFVAMRLIPAAFSLGTIFVILFVWRFFSQKTFVFWESLALAALMGCSGWYIVLSRRGDMAIPLLCFFLLYVAVAYRFLYTQGSYLLIPVLVG